MKRDYHYVMAKRGPSRRTKKRSDAELIEFARAAVEVRHKEALQRVQQTIDAYHDGGIALYAKLARRTERFKPIWELFDELNAVPEACKSEPGVAYHPRAVMELVILRFLDAFIDSGGLHPASFYRDTFGIPASRLRQAVARRKLKAHKIGGATLYAIAEVRALWSEDVSFSP